jgi:hypothetical protein
MSPLITFENLAVFTMDNFRAILPNDEWNESPSYTFPLRFALLKILKPSILSLAALEPAFGFAVEIVWGAAKKIYFAFMTYVILVGVIWVVKGRPPFAEFTQTSILTRFLYKTGGSLEDVDQDTEKGKRSSD